MSIFFLFLFLFGILITFPGIVRWMRKGIFVGGKRIIFGMFLVFGVAWGFLITMGTKLEVVRGIEKQILLSRDSDSRRKLSKEDVPKEILSKCQDARGQVADLEEYWNFSDVIDSRPQSRLTLLCRYPDQSWLVYCEMGGFTVRSFEVQAKPNSEGYKITVANREAPRRCPLDY